MYRRRYICQGVRRPHMHEDLIDLDCLAKPFSSHSKKSFRNSQHKILIGKNVQSLYSAQSNQPTGNRQDLLSVNLPEHIHDINPHPKSSTKLSVIVATRAATIRRYRNSRLHHYISPTNISHHHSYTRT